MGKYSDAYRALTEDEVEALEDLAAEHGDFWDALLEDYLEHGRLTKRQYACLIEEMNR